VKQAKDFRNPEEKRVRDHLNAMRISRVMREGSQ
jgi:hypothetical protein